MTGHHGGATALESLGHPISTLAHVDSTLDAVCTSLEEGWASRSPEVMDVLAQDLPAMLRTRLLPPMGKRLRPVMCHWGWVASGGVEDGGGHEQLVATGAALELLHLFALVHDDIMDRSDARRGQPAAHVEAQRDHRRADALGDGVLFGDSVAMLLGDLALSEAGHLVAGAGLGVRTLWQEMLRELVHGQLLDITGAAARRRDVAFGRRVARLKSGAYTIQRPLQLGAAAGGAGPAVTAALSAYGEHLGEAFALRDDALGVWGDPRVTGKPSGDDLLSGKATVILAVGRQRLPEDESERLLGPHAVVTPAEVPRLQQLLVDHGVLDEIERRIECQCRSAIEALDAAPLDVSGRAGLAEMVDVVGWRSA